VKEIVSASLLALLLISMLTLAVCIRPVKAGMHFPEVILSPESPFTIDNINVTVSFPFSTMPPAVEEFGSLIQVDNTFSIDVSIYVPAPDEYVLMVVHDDRNTYNLGQLPEGAYEFEVYVTYVHYLEGLHYLAGKISFMVDKPKPELLLETDKYIYKLGENITITLTNIGNQTVEIGGHPAWQIFTYPDEEPVYPIVYSFLIWWLAPGENESLTWSQYDVLRENYVDPRTYIIKDLQGWGLITYFKIVDAEIIVPDEYPTIQEAINNANEGDTVYVKRGTYFENVIVNKTVSLIGEDKTETIIDGGGINSSIRVSANNVLISGFTVQNGRWEAVCIWDYSNATVVNNILVHSTFGVMIANGQNNTITSNVILENGFGIQVAGWPAWSNTISSNMLANNTWGIEIHDVGGSNIIRDNIIISSSTGLHLSDSHGNIIYENNIIQSGYGIFVVSSSNSYIFHNNFINNTNQVYFVDSFNNTWDNGCEGNYWSNYNGTDLGTDGIGDTELPCEGVDYYPLINLYWSPGDVNHDLKVDIYDVVRITAVYGSREGDDNWNPHSDIAEPYGIIDIYDVVRCTGYYGKERNNS